jgi:integrase/recombinase XerD
VSISAHRLRHTCATEMLRHGANLRAIQKTLGHADIRTTEGYLDLLTEQQHAAIGRLPDRFR